MLILVKSPVFLLAIYISAFQNRAISYSEETNEVEQFESLNKNLVLLYLIINL